MTVIAMWVRSYFAYDRFTRLSGDTAGLNVQTLQARFSEGRFEFGLAIFQVPGGGSANAALRGRAIWSHIANAPPIDQHRKGWWYFHPPRYVLPLKHPTALIVTAPGSALTTHVRASGGWIDSWTVGFQLWLAAGLTFLPLPWIARHAFLNRHAATQGFCSRCGHDLRATPDRCPECGTAVKSST